MFLHQTKTDLLRAIGLIETSAVVTICIKATTDTPWSPPLPSVGTLMGGLSVRRYLSERHATINTRPRLRILSLVVTENIFTFDMDNLPKSKQDELLAALHNKIWIGHNLHHALMWISFTAPKVAPSRMIDSFLLLLTHFPDFLWAVKEASTGGKRVGNPAWTENIVSDGDIKEAIAAYFTGVDISNALQPHNTLDILSLALRRQHLTKEPILVTWSLSVLPERAITQCNNRVGVIREVIHHLLLDSNLSDDSLIIKIRENPGLFAYAAITKAIPTLLRMQSNGMPINRDRVAKYSDTCKNQCSFHMNALLSEAPELLSFKESMLSGSLTQEFKSTLSQALDRLSGFDHHDNPHINSDTLKLTYPGLPAVEHYLGVTTMARRFDTAESFLSMSDRAGRLHSTTAVTAVTCRTSSCDPPLQAAPGDPDFRAVFKAKPGHAIIAADYKAIEMRIVAALSSRAYACLRSIVNAAMCGNTSLYAKLASESQLNRLMRSDNLIWRLVELLNGSASKDSPIRAARPDFESSSPQGWMTYYADRMYEICHKIWRSGGFQLDAADDRLTLPSIFMQKIDPHLATAVTLSGRLPSSVGIIDYMASRNDVEMHEITGTLKEARQSAKSCNFGLVYALSAEGLHTYGITNYGLSWTLGEASAAHDAWFDLYPETDLWHLMTRFNHIKLSNHFSIGISKKLFYGSTLSKRVIVADKLPAALNFQSQGTGAEIAMTALSTMERELKNYVVHFSHDELVFEVPSYSVNRVALEIENLMVKSADKLLSPFGVPGDVQVTIGDSWRH